MKSFTKLLNASSEAFLTRKFSNFRTLCCVAVKWKFNRFSEYFQQLLEQATKERCKIHKKLRSQVLEIAQLKYKQSCKLSC